MAQVVIIDSTAFSHYKRVSILSIVHKHSKPDFPVFVAILTPDRIDSMPFIWLYDGFIPIKQESICPALSKRFTGENRFTMRLSKIIRFTIWLLCRIHENKIFYVIFTAVFVTILYNHSSNCIKMILITEIYSFHYFHFL